MREADQLLQCVSSAGKCRTAIALPIRNEDVPALGLRLTELAVAIAAVRGHFVDLWLLSDTNDVEIADAERSLVLELTERRVPIQYRQRLNGRGRKHGNLLNFATQQGSVYEYMIVIDADSSITAEAIQVMINHMVANPNVAVVQTVPYPAGLITLYARWLQFRARLYTPEWIRGNSWWQDGRSTYWGHNAIVDVAAFVANGEMPVLSGRPPLGGAILSHDAIEAAMFIKAGKRVEILTYDVGSREQVPANIVDSMVRERRWCEGNLQNLRLALTRKLGGTATISIALDAWIYLKSLPYLALAAVIVGRVATAGFGRTLTVAAGLWVFSSFHKFISLYAELTGTGCARVPRRAVDKVRSFCAELALEYLMQPLSLIVSAVAILSVAAGATAEWAPQPRGDRELGSVEAMRRLLPFSLAGLAAIAATVALLGCAAGALLLVMSAGLLLAPALALATSRVRFGATTLKWGLFTIDEEC